MKVYVEEWAGTLACQADDKDAKPGKYLRVSVPAHWIEMKRLEGFDRKPSFLSVPKPNIAHYGLALFAEKAFIEAFGPGLTPMDVVPGDGERASVVSTAAVAEWLAEAQGYTHTLRFTRMLDTRAFREEIEEEIDADTVAIPHVAHFAIKCRNADTITLLNVKYGEYRTQFDTYSSLSDMLRFSQS